MIFCESISREQFMRNLSMFRANRPELAWGLDDPPEGAALYYLPALDAYFALNDLGGGAYDLGSVFRFGTGAGGAGTAIFDAARTLGCKYLFFTAYAGAAKAWRKAGATRVDEDYFDSRLAPPCWRSEYGTPDIIYFEKDL